MSERTDIIAKTARGAVIRTFASADLAMAWSAAEGRDFPGYTISARTEQTIVTERVLRRDRGHLKVVAA